MKYDKIALIGFMGSGKSTIGKALAKRLEFAFLDTDTLIEEEQKQTISDIFLKKGESFFRGSEQDLIDRLASKNGVVIATGGGLPIFSSIDASIFVVYIDLDFSSIQTRMTETERENRPLFNNSDNAQRLFSQRQAIYEEVASVTVDGKQSVDAIVEDIIKCLS